MHNAPRGENPNSQDKGGGLVGWDGGRADVMIWVADDCGAFTVSIGCNAHVLAKRAGRGVGIRTLPFASPWRQADWLWTRPCFLHSPTLVYGYKKRAANVGPPSFHFQYCARGELFLLAPVHLCHAHITLIALLCHLLRLGEELFRLVRVSLLYRQIAYLAHEEVVELRPIRSL